MPLSRLCCLALLTGCSGKATGSWELVDASWTAIEFEDDTTRRTLEVLLELEHTRKTVTGTATMTKTTEVGDAEPEVRTESSPVDGEEETGGAIYIDAEPLFAFECELEGDQMVCMDSELDEWEFARTGK